MPALTTTIALLLTRDDGGFSSRLFQDGQAVAPPRTIAMGAYRALHFVTELYRQHTRGPAAAPLVEQALVAMGTELFQLWLGPEWPALTLDDRPRHWVVASDLLELLVLPWELLHPPSGGFLGLSPAWTLARLAATTPPATPWPTAASRRMLLFESRPADRPPLDSPWQATALAPDHVVTSGHAGDLTTALADVQPEIVWLHGHALVRNGTGHFCLCEASGQSQVVTAAELCGMLSAGPRLQGVVVSGREVHHPPPVAATHAVASQLAGHAAPWILAWPDAPFARHGQPLTLALHQSLLDRQPLAAAITRARQQAQAMDGAGNYPVWTLPALYRGGGIGKNLATSR